MSKNVDFIAKKNYAFFLSIALSLISIVLILTKGMNFSIDFRGGTKIDFYSSNSDTDTVIKDRLDYKDLEIYKTDKNFNGNSYRLNVDGNFSDEEISKLKTVIRETFKDVEIFRTDSIVSIDFKGGIVLDFNTKTANVEAILAEKLQNKFSIEEIKTDNPSFYTIKIGSKTQVEPEQIINSIKSIIYDAEITNIDFVGPKVGSAFTSDAVKAIAFSLIAMMIYVWFRFDLQFGVGVMLALFHDVLITLGFFSLANIQFDLTSVAVILTIVGYSINDSIVIYDRIRENLKEKISNIKRDIFSALVNRSLNETLSRTIMTSFTTLVVCIALLIFGGEGLRGFSAALSFGIAFGTYSSIYVSAPVLIFFTRK